MSMLIAALVAAATSASAAPPADDSPEEIAEDAARDLKDSRFYNRPGATRADYDADWQKCRLIARGSRTPSGTVPMFYNPNIISPVAAGIAGGIGGLIGAKIAEGAQRRANRRSCLLVGGWRLIETDEATKMKVAAMTDAERDAHFAGIVGAAEVAGQVETFTNHWAAPKLAAGVDPAGRIVAPAALTAGKKVDLSRPLPLAADQGAILVAFRRADAHALGKSATASFARHDGAQNDLHYRPRDWKKRGDTTTYTVQARSIDKKAGLELHILPVTAGRYVLTGAEPGPFAGQHIFSFCLGAPAFDVKAGEIVYFGDLTPYMTVPAAAGGKVMAMPFSRDADAARALLAARQPALAAAFKPAALQNDATWGCAGQSMTAYRVPTGDALAASATAAAQD